MSSKLKVSIDTEALYRLFSFFLSFSPAPSLEQYRTHLSSRNRMVCSKYVLRAVLAQAPQDSGSKAGGSLFRKLGLIRDDVSDSSASKPRDLSSSQSVGAIESVCFGCMTGTTIFKVGRRKCKVFCVTKPGYDITSLVVFCVFLFFRLLFSFDDVIGVPAGYRSSSV